MAEIANAKFLRDLNPRELQKIVAITNREHYTTDETIVAVGERIGSLRVVASGAVRVVVPIEGQHGREEQTLATLGPGDCFGEFSFVDRDPASASVLANEETHIHALPHADLDVLLESDPYLARKLLAGMLQLIVSRFRSTDANLALTRYVLQYV